MSLRGQYLMLRRFKKYKVMTKVLKGHNIVKNLRTSNYWGNLKRPIQFNQFCIKHDILK